MSYSKIHVHWYVREPEQARKIKATSKNPNYLTTVKFRPKRITVSSDINEVVSRSEWLVIAIPSAYLGDELKLLTQPIKSKILVQGIKGAQMEMNMVAEGYHATRSIYAKSQQLKIKKQTPIITSAYNILYEEKDPKTQITKLESEIA